MLLKKNKNNLLLLFSFFQISFSQSYLPSLQINFDELNLSSTFIPEVIASSNVQLILLDKQNHRLARMVDDSLHLVGGFGSSKYSLFDPVDIIADQLDIFVLDQSTGRITRLDSRLNFIQFSDFTLDESRYPTVFSIDSRRNIYFYSPDEDIIYKTQSLTSKFDKFVDLNLNPSTANCLKDISIDQKDQIGIIFNCNNELFIYNRAGRLQRKFKIKIKNPLKAFSINNKWSIINTEGQIQFFDSSVINLEISENAIIDLYMDQNQLYVLTKTEIFIFDTYSFSR
ncbi:MAG: hypothetical protein VX887_02365 [Candidatus Neomarinimicrobiota bacterium]|nr:hypothetical protein [Candidatus Neomarinimicrobiota bacterium]